MNTVLRFGLLYGAIECLWMLLLYVTGLNRLEMAWVFRLPSLAVAVICVMQAVKHFRLGAGNGFISFGKAFRTSLGVLITGSVIISIFTFVDQKFIDTQKMDIEFQRQIEKMEANGMPEENIEQAIAMRDKFNKPWILLSFALAGSLVFSLIMALILAAILKKENPEEIR